MADAALTEPWRHPLRWTELRGGRRRLRLAADEAQRERVAGFLGLEAVKSFEADVMAAPWLDGVEITGRFDALVTQVCGVSLDPFDAQAPGEIRLRLVPAGSPNAPEARDAEIIIDPEAEDPPDVVDGDTVDLGQYLVEHLALALDPFPRKPGVVFEPPEDSSPPSPFAVLSKLKLQGDKG